MQERRLASEDGDPLGSSDASMHGHLAMYVTCQDDIMKALLGQERLG